MQRPSTLQNSQQKHSPKNGTSPHDYSTMSSDEQKHYSSVCRMINSEHLTPEMAINYLFEWRSNLKLLPLVLNRIREFCSKHYMRYVPVTVFILTLQSNVLFQKFVESLANESMPIYLIIRWSYSTYMHQNRLQAEKMINKIDSSLIKRFKENDFKNLTEEGIKNKIEEKVHLSNYSQLVNEFFQRLFKIPQKLKKYDKSKRNEKLKEHMEKIFKKFRSESNFYVEGVAFPFEQQSPVMVRIVEDECFTFSTKERVPFKLVFETISLEDAKKLKQGIKPEVDNRTKNRQNEKVDKLNSSSKCQQEELQSEVRNTRETKSNLQQEKGVQTKSITQPPAQSLILPRTYFGIEWKQHLKKIQLHSPYCTIPSYCVRSYMIKSGDDLRQQYTAMQLIRLIHQIAVKQNLKLWVRPYHVIPFNNDSGLIQFVDDTKTVSYLKQKSGEKSLKNIYKQIFGMNWQLAVTNFIESLAGYSLIQYLFSIKDRHNNNILIDTYGHLIHIDFSFMISSSPGNMGFESAPFKLTGDYLQLMEGVDSDIFGHFKLLFFLGLKYIRKYKKEIMESVIMMTHCPGMKCFEKFDKEQLERKFHENATDEELEIIVDKIVYEAQSSYRTSGYDKFQWYTNFIIP